VRRSVEPFSEFRRAGNPVTICCLAAANIVTEPLVRIPVLRQLVAWVVA
jgi:hypothetical protein